MKRLFFLAVLGIAHGCAQVPVAVEGSEPVDPVSSIVEPDLYASEKPDPIQVIHQGRYALVSTAPSIEQQHLMSQIVDITIPPNINATVREAMDYTMLRSGYTLCDAPMPEVATLYSRPLPAAHYRLGPMTLGNALQVLAGPAFYVVADELARNVCLVVRSEYQPQPVLQAPPQAVETRPVEQNADVEAVAFEGAQQ